MTDLSLHLAPNAPWLLLLALGVAFLALGVWAYRIAVPPLPRRARRLLPALRVAALLLLAGLLGQPVLGALLLAAVGQVVALGWYNLRLLKGQAESQGRVVGDVRWGKR